MQKIHFAISIFAFCLSSSLLCMFSSNTFLSAVCCYFCVRHQQNCFSEFAHSVVCNFVALFSTPDFSEKNSEKKEGERERNDKYTRFSGRGKPPSPPSPRLSIFSHFHLPPFCASFLACSLVCFRCGATRPLSPSSSSSSVCVGIVAKMLGRMVVVVANDTEQKHNTTEPSRTEKCRTI